MSKKCILICANYGQLLFFSCVTSCVPCYTRIEDTLDLVPVAAFHGKRTGVCGSFLLACYDDNNEEYQGICKIGIGFTEAVCEECSASLRSKVIPEPKSYYHYTGEMPDVWFEAAERTTLFS
ncbi:hypothetical protein V6Z11_A08G233300 [Gossypium hirsutum]